MMERDVSTTNKVTQFVKNFRANVFLRKQLTHFPAKCNTTLLG